MVLAMAPCCRGSVPIGGMSACRESLESVECKYAKVVSLEIVLRGDLLGSEHKCR